MRIEPTVGRVLWFFSAPGDALFGQQNPGEPLAAQVAHVHDDETINIAVFDRDGNAHARQRVLLVQPDEAKPDDRPFCVWMPYQKGQAAKTDSLEPRVNELDQLLQETAQTVKSIAEDLTNFGQRLVSIEEARDNAAKPPEAANSPAPA